jgi:hypothetical protein
MIHHLFYVVINKHINLRRIGDDSRAFDVTKHDLYPIRDTDNPKEPQVVRLETWKIMQWNLLTHAGYATFPHKDANGLCTWVYAHVGIKIWAVVRPKCTEQHDSDRKLTSLHREVLNAGADELDQHGDVFTVFLSTGTLL